MRSEKLKSHIRLWWGLLVTSEPLSESSDWETITVGQHNLEVEMVTDRITFSRTCYKKRGNSPKNREEHLRINVPSDNTESIVSKIEQEVIYLMEHPKETYFEESHMEKIEEPRMQDTG